MKSALRVFVTLSFILFLILVQCFTAFADSATDYFNKGNSLSGSGKYEEAINSFNKAIEINPNVPEFYYKKSMCLSNLGKYDEAIALYDRVINLDSDFKEAYLYKGKCLMQVGKLDYALETINQYMDRYPEEPDAYILKGHILLNMKRYTEVIDTSDKLIDLNIDDKKTLSLAYSNKGCALADVGRTGEALTASNKALELDGTNTDAYVAISFVYNFQGKYEEAVKMCDNIIKIDKNSVQAYINKANFLLNDQKYQESIACSDKAAEISGAQNPKNKSDILVIKSGAFCGLEKYELALDAAEQAIKINPQAAEAYSNKGNALGKLGKYEESIVACDKAIQIDSKLAESFFFKSYSLCKLKRYVEAIEACKMTIEVGYRSPGLCVQAYMNMGTALSGQGNHEEALDMFEEALGYQIEDSDTLSSIYSHKANTLLELKKFDEVLENSEKSIEINPANSEGYISKSSALMGLLKYNEALEYCNRAIENKFLDYRIYNNRGLALEKKGKLDEALQSFNRSLELKTDDKVKENRTRVLNKINGGRIRLVLGILFILVLIAGVIIIAIYKNKKKNEPVVLEDVFSGIDF